MNTIKPRTPFEFMPTESWEELQNEIRRT